MTKRIDFLIVGQGLAGSLLYWSLTKRGRKVYVIDQYNPSSSSNVAAGIIHPITGRRMVKTWMADILVPFAESTYLEIEKQFNEKLFHRKNILELISSVKEQNDWNTRKSSPGMQDYFGEEKTEDLYAGFLAGSPKKISIAKSGWLNLAKMIRLFSQQLTEQDLLLEDNFDHDHLSIQEDGITYKNVQADKIIFCEGYLARQNPYWNHLPFLPAKGEVLTIRSETLRLDHILTKTIFVLPLGEHLFLVGSTYVWDELNETPTAKAKEYLLKQLETIIKVPYEVVDHQAAIRPTVKDRRPFIGFHHNHSQVGIFNGLGTKGVLLAPWFANHFAEHLSGKTELMNDVDVKRLLIH